MYLHLGNGYVAAMADILAVCDLDNASSSHLTRAFLRRAEEEGRVVNACADLPKAFVLCAGPGGGTVYLSQLNSATLLKRAETNSFE